MDGLETGQVVKPVGADTREDNCGKCDWWVPCGLEKWKTPRGEEVAGYCHGAPPIYISNFGWVWPNTGENAWCGLFKERKAE